MIPAGGRATEWDWVGNLTNSNQTPNASGLQCRSETTGAKLRRSKGGQPRPPSKAPKSPLSGEGGGAAYTTRRLA